MTTWFPLDPARADLGATAGAYVNGFTLLEHTGGPPPVFTVTGICSCATRESAERIAMNSHASDADRRISRKTLNSWRV